MTSLPSTKPRRLIPQSWQGDWTPIRFHLSDVLLVLWAATFQAWFRGTDYVTGGEEKHTASLSYVERVMPIHIWGWCFLSGAAALGIGVLLRRHFMVWLGHSILLILYVCLFLGLLFQSLETPPWFDGIRNATVLIVVICIHAISWWRTGPRPLPVPTYAPRPTVDDVTRAEDLEEVR